MKKLCQSVQTRESKLGKDFWIHTNFFCWTEERRSGSLTHLPSLSADKLWACSWVSAMGGKNEGQSHCVCGVMPESVVEENLPKITSEPYPTQWEEEDWEKTTFQEYQHGHVWWKYWTGQWEDSGISESWVRWSHSSWFKQIERNAKWETEIVTKKCIGEELKLEDQSVVEG